jgi:hypothetical protein
MIGQRRIAVFPRFEGIAFQIVNDASLRRIFDLSLDLIHYAGSCQRVGRCMRLAILWNGMWAGGIVLGSTFPNINVRDEHLGLKPFVRNTRERGLENPWSRHNVQYWTSLQTIVNHARTFIFPSFQGQGIGKKAHAELLRGGFRLWEQHYKCKVFALDTLCDSADSGLFISNGWTLAGQTKGFTADYAHTFAKKRNVETSINNAALKKGKTAWQVWIKIVRAELRPKVICQL